MNHSDHIRLPGKGRLHRNEEKYYRIQRKVHPQGGKILRDSNIALPHAQPWLMQQTDAALWRHDFRAHNVTNVDHGTACGPRFEKI